MNDMSFDLCCGIHSLDERLAVAQMRVLVESDDDANPALVELQRMYRRVGAVLQRSNAGSQGVSEALWRQELPEQRQDSRAVGNNEDGQALPL